jgi:acetyl-CoA acetyltransferase
LELPGQLGALINAMSAVASGLAEHVLCFRTVWESSAQQAIGNRSATVTQRVHRDSDQWGKPYGVSYPTYGALMMQRYMHDSGATREQIAQVALTARANAALTEDAPYRDPLSLDDYMSARMISEPLCLYDCDVPIDGSVAFVVSTATDRTMSRGRSIPIRAIGSASGMEESGRMLWSRTELRPTDVKAAHLYDGFSVLALKWMEALQLCPPHESGRFVDGGKRIARDGILPLNTAGGQLSGGRLHGFGGFYEACVQARGEAGSRQVLPVPSASIISSGTATFSSCILIGSAFDLP